MPTYKQPKPAPEAKLKKEDSGYPEGVSKTQTQKTRGTGAATKGTGYSKNSQ